MTNNDLRFIIHAARQTGRSGHRFDAFADNLETLLNAAESKPGLAALHEAAGAGSGDVAPTPCPKPTHFTQREGTQWIAWESRDAFAHLDGGRNYMHIHSIKFSDGSILDTVNGWRK